MGLGKWAGGIKDEGSGKIGCRKHNAGKRVGVGMQVGIHSNETLGDEN